MNVDPHPFDELITRFREYGFPENADRLAMLMRSVWTSSSEFIGELGLTVLRFQREQPSVRPELREVLDRCVREARKVWPDIW